MQQIANWLQKLGLGQYAQHFAENDIDASVLPELTDQDLKDLGISLGHRRKMLRAIRDLGGASAAVTTPSAPAETEPARRDDAERRQLTVMFTDLVGSTALSTKLDPEDLRSVIGTYHRCVAETVARFDGFLAKYMGDRVLTYFRLPAGRRAGHREYCAGRPAHRRSSHAQVSCGPGAGIAPGLVVLDDLI